MWCNLDIWDSFNLLSRESSSNFRGITCHRCPPPQGKSRICKKSIQRSASWWDPDDSGGMIRWGSKNQRSPYGSWMSITVFFLSIGKKYLYMYNYRLLWKIRRELTYSGLINLIPAVQLFTPLISRNLPSNWSAFAKKLKTFEGVVDKERKQSLFKNQWFFDDFCRSGKRWACWRLISPHWHHIMKIQVRKRTRILTLMFVYAVPAPLESWKAYAPTGAGFCCFRDTYACPLAGDSKGYRLLHIS